MAGSGSLIAIFTEAGPRQGYGHLSRCCAIYDECLRQGHGALLAINADGAVDLGGREATILNWLDHGALGEFMEGLTGSHKPPMGDASAAPASRAAPRAYAVVDSYMAEEAHYEAISRAFTRCAYIDDYMRVRYPRGMVVNPSICGDRLPYDLAEGSTLLGGAEYAIVRPEFRDPAPPRPAVPRKDAFGGLGFTIMVTMGGSDVLGMTPWLLSMLAREYPRARKTAVLGPGYGDSGAAEAAADGMTELFKSLSASGMRSLMLGADVAISAAGQ
ncbi:MAG: hypothetical protein FWE70_07280, partial [Oscillospiraceae bacterium]|nr:hypothetical protein [Oscillospiraceae bacterium]